MIVLEEEDRTLNFWVIFILMLEEEGSSLDNLPDPGNIIILDIDIILIRTLSETYKYRISSSVGNGGKGKIL